MEGADGSRPVLRVERDERDEGVGGQRHGTRRGHPAAALSPRRPEWGSARPLRRVPHPLRPPGGPDRGGEEQSQGSGEHAPGPPVLRLSSRATGFSDPGESGPAARTGETP